uniref:PCI domain-containing protein n=1 Tax=Pyramimonas obovata TaxID=1411642 RepID=A0A7S0R011_9CHLO|mmetsp:Transcript_21038/g.46138  ORF Transcript_21038/g.46138 Transcript_21038/m.46138 type:complete len:392 (+) Transcript_21038:246-1421(+)|eukprot:CAMPEP_0118933406 /NCGR_PEP_ID=MMETSP1169-20130426/11969_1 /TAXON_ID=36882 /ORGANISM="Pyramimonas obovata, Strain CCMP722" /LENGTH=391 /DNA_ID=CAMNT_0006876161 /DNA_START=241 /DNA_END=1416 /DNA_ORIENTATION=-
MAQIAFLKEQSLAYPAMAPHYTVLADLYERKLWHQLTDKLEEIVRLPESQNEAILTSLYSGFISDFEMKLNLLRLAHIIVAISSRYTDRERAFKFLGEAVARIQDTKEPSRIRGEPVLYLQMHIALLKLQGGDVLGCKEMLEEGKPLLDNLIDVDPSVHASLHHVASMYHKAKQDFAEFFKSGMLYLAYISVDSLDEVTKLALAVDLSLAALLGEDIYNFGELIAHPVVKTLTDPKSSYGWLKDLLVAFNAGDLDKYDALCTTHAAALNAQPALVQNERRLREKITILCLMEIIFSLPSENRVISLAHIAEKTKLSLDGVEFLLMKTLSVHLIEGVIDQVDATVAVSWVQPRVLGLQQISELRSRLDGWLDKVHSTLLTVDSETPELVGMP